MGTDEKRNGKLVLGVLLAVLAGTLYSAWQVTPMPERPQLSGQWWESNAVEGIVHTERYVDESLEDWHARHEEAIREHGGLSPR